MTDKPENSKGFQNIDEKIARLIDDLRKAKPNDRSLEDRAFAVVLTDIEKARAYLNFYVLRK